MRTNKQHTKQTMLAPKRKFFDDAARLGNCTDAITTEITCELNKGTEDTHFHTVVIKKQKGTPGVWRAFISPLDCDTFEKHGACILNVRDQDSTNGHVIFMTRNESTGACEIYDPNGPFENSFPNKNELKELFQAINMGLLRPLTSPKGNQTTFSVSLQSPVEGLQQKELEMDQSMFKILFENDVLVNQTEEWLATYNAFRNFKEFWASPNKSFGFCAAWSIFRFVAHYYKRTLDIKDNVYDKAEHAFLTNSDKFKVYTEANDVLYSKFCNELGLLEENSVAQTVFKEILPCIFIRLFSAYVVMKSESSEQSFFTGSYDGSWKSTLSEISNYNGNIPIFGNKDVWEQINIREVFWSEETLWGTRKIRREETTSKEYICSVDTSRPFKETLTQHYQPNSNHPSRSIVLEG